MAGARLSVRGGQIGDYVEIVTITKPTVVVDPIAGQSEGPPETIAENIPAAVESLGIGQERLQVGQLRGIANKLVRMWSRDDITDDMIVEWDGTTLEIGLIDYVGDELFLYCAEVQ